MLSRANFYPCRTKYFTRARTTYLGSPSTGKIWYGYRKRQHGSGKICSVNAHPSLTKNFSLFWSALLHQAHEVISVVSLVKMEETQVHARVKAQ